MPGKGSSSKRRGRAWPRLLCCCSHREGFPSPPAGQAGGTETSKISWLFSEEEAAKNCKNKTGLETLGYKTGASLKFSLKQLLK